MVYVVGIYIYIKYIYIYIYIYHIYISYLYYINNVLLFAFILLNFILFDENL